MRSPVGSDTDGEGCLVLLLGKGELDGLHGVVVANAGIFHLVAEVGHGIACKEALGTYANGAGGVGCVHINCQYIVSLRQTADDLRYGCGKGVAVVVNSEDVAPVGRTGLATSVGVDTPP